jgi:hypothetical protein
MADDYAGRSASKRVFFRYQRAMRERDRARDRCVVLDGVIAEAIRQLKAVNWDTPTVAYYRALGVLKDGGGDGPDDH